MTRDILPMERWKFFCYSALGFLLAPFILLISWYRTIRQSNSDTPNILVVPIMTRVGDLVCATVAFRAIKLKYPDARLTVLVGKKVIDLLKANNRYDIIININDIPFKGFWGRGRLFNFIFKQKFDAVISLTNNPFNNLVNWFSAAPMRVKTIMKKRSIAERFTDIFSNKRLVYEVGTLLQAHYVRLLQFIGVPFSPPIKELMPTKEGDEKVLEYFKTIGITSDSPIVGITPSAGHQAKEWPADRFAEVARYLIEQYDARILLIDSPANDDKVKSVISYLPEGLRTKVFSTTNFSLAELPSLIKKLHTFIAVDTGSIYIAHTLGVPLIDITGPVDPNDQPPQDEKSIQVRPPASMKTVFSVLGSPDKEAYREASNLVNAISPQAVNEAFDLLVRSGFVTTKKSAS